MRIQILRLPAPADEQPFALIVDQCSPEEATSADWGHFKADTNCRALGIFSGTVELP